MSLCEESHRLLVDGRSPHAKAHFLIFVRRGVSGDFIAIALDLVMQPNRERVLYTWSAGIDPGLDHLGQTYGLIQKALIDLDRTLARWQIRIAIVEANHGAVPRRSVEWQLLKELVEARGEVYTGMRAPIGLREPPDHDHVLTELIGVSSLYLCCSPMVPRGVARVIS